MTIVMSASQVRNLAYQNYPDWAYLVDYSDMTVNLRLERKGSSSHQYVEISATFHHRKLDDTRTVVARTQIGFGNKLDRLFAAWDKQWRTAKRLGNTATVSPQQRGTKRGVRYVQVVYIDDERDAAEVDIQESIRHNGLRKPLRGERNLQRAYVYRWPFAGKPERGHWVIGSGTLAFVTRLSKSGSDYHGYTVDLDAFIGGDARRYSREQILKLVEKYPRDFLNDEYYSGRFPDS